MRGVLLKDLTPLLLRGGRSGAGDLSRSSPSSLAPLQSHVTARSRPGDRRAARWPRARSASFLPMPIKADTDRGSPLPATARSGNRPWYR